MKGQAHTPVSRSRAIVEIALSWMIPGSGFILHRDYYRGIVIFCLLTLTFLIGLSINGGVVFPVWSPSSEGFNIISILTYLSQMGYGSLSLLSLAGARSGLPFFQGQESAAFFDLAAFYLIISGGINYLMLYNLWDRHLAPQKGKDTSRFRSSKNEHG